MRRIALTGGIATGKSYVRRRLEALGVATIDSDVLARAALAPGTPGLAAVVARFGRDMIDEGGALDRQRLAGVVFQDAEARRALEEIVHPEVRRATEAWFSALDPAAHPYAVADVPLLYETGRDRDFDAVIVAACDPATQLRRAMLRDGLTAGDVRRRMAAQWPIAEKVRRADYVIRTDGTFADTDRQVADVARQLEATG